jgi:hypothetical protein
VSTGENLEKIQKNPNWKPFSFDSRKTAYGKGKPLLEVEIKINANEKKKL